MAQPAIGIRVTCVVLSRLQQRTGPDGSSSLLIGSPGLSKLTLKLRVATADAVAHRIVNFISLFGCSIELYSDNGKNLTSNVMQAICRILGVTKLCTVPYRPSSNGLTERENLTLKRLISHFLNQRATDWDTHLDVLLMVMRSSVHATLKETPNMMFGQQVHLPIHSLLPGPPGEKQEELPPSQYTADLQDALHAGHEAVAASIGAKYQYQKRYYDRTVKPVEYDVGQAVWLRVYPRAPG